MVVGQRSRTLLVLLGAALVLSACTGTAGPSTPPTSGGPSVPGVTSPAATASVDVTPPPAPPGITTLAVFDPQSGTAARALSADAGSLWIFVRCSGDSLVVDVKGIASMLFTCGGSGTQQYGNEIELASARSIDITITPNNGTVRWSARIGYSTGK